ncbi:unnamed protein product [Protopolystoma xenopodis]|uniref:Uncharacterized protein n=1 Tax=Protopolystoma xenopodis TaxID=117903 RepID=A0A3S5CMV5_9PLAT|nr:unnamed protein product [Protopolystoma xenopodis]
MPSALAWHLLGPAGGLDISAMPSRVCRNNNPPQSGCFGRECPNYATSLSTDILSRESQQRKYFEMFVYLSVFVYLSSRLPQLSPFLASTTSDTPFSDVLSVRRGCPMTF